MIRAIAGHDLLAARELSRELEGILVRLRTTIGEEEHVDVTRRDLCQLRAEARSRHNPFEGDPEAVAAGGKLFEQHPEWFGQDGTAVEVQVAGAVRRVEIDALGPLDGDGVDGRLCRPLIQRMLAAERDDLLPAHVVGCDLDGHLSPPC